MSKYISIFFLAIMAGIGLIILISTLFDGSDIGMVVAGEFVIVVLLSFLIAQMFYLIDWLKKRV